MYSDYSGIQETISTPKLHLHNRCSNAVKKLCVHVQNVPKKINIAANEWLNYPLEKFNQFSWRNYATISAVHGLKFIFGKTNLTLLTRLWRITLFLLCTGLCLYKCAYYTAVYYEKNLVTSIHRNTIVEKVIKFPSILLCNAHPFRKSFFGEDDISLFALAYISTSTVKEAFDLVKKHGKYCKSNISSTNDSLLHGFDRFNPTEMNVNDFIYDSQLNMDFSCIMCWWKGQEIDCFDILTSYIISDYKYCFILDNQTGIRDNGVSEVYSNARSERLLRTDGYGPEHGFKILLNAHQDEMCGLNEPWSGVGFRFAITSPEIQATLPSDFHTFLSPGYSYEISMTPVFKSQQSLKSEGICDFVYKVADENNTVVGECVHNCLLKLLLTNCNCYPPGYEFGAVYFARLMNINITDLVECDTSKVQCAFGNLKLLNEHSIYKLCGDCKEPCFQEKYEISITFKKFPANRFSEKSSTNKSKNILLGDEYHSYKEARSNFLIANFYFKEPTKYDIVNSLAINTEKLFVQYIGCAMSLFLGMSFMSPFEIVIQVFIFMHFKIRSLFEGHKQTKVVNLMKVDIKQNGTTCVTSKIPLANHINTHLTQFEIISQNTGEFHSDSFENKIETTSL